MTENGRPINAFAQDAATLLDALADADLPISEALTCAHAYATLAVAKELAEVKRLLQVLAENSVLPAYDKDHPR